MQTIKTTEADANIMADVITGLCALTKVKLLAINNSLIYGLSCIKYTEKTDGVMKEIIFLERGVVLIFEKTAIQPTAITKTIGEQYEIKTLSRAENGKSKKWRTHFAPNETERHIAMLSGFLK